MGCACDFYRSFTRKFSPDGNSAAGLVGAIAISLEAEESFPLLDVGMLDGSVKVCILCGGMLDFRGEVESYQESQDSRKTKQKDNISRNNFMILG